VGTFAAVARRGRKHSGLFVRVELLNVRPSRYGCCMAATGLEVRLHEGRERAEATRVARTLNEVVWSLQDIDKVYLLHGTRATWVMADMHRKDDDLVLRLEPRNVPAKRDTLDMMVPVEALVKGATSLAEQPVVPELFAPKTVTRVAALAEPRNGIQSVTLTTYNGRSGQSAFLSDQVRMNAASAVRPFEVTYGSVSGTLSGLREVKKGAVRVTVRDTVGRQAIEGIVPASMAEDLRSAWRHRVALSGKVKRNARGQAIRIEVDHIELLPEGNSGRPSTDALLGVGADWLDGMTVDDFLREVRNG